MDVIGHDTIGKHCYFVNDARAIINFLVNVLSYFRIFKICFFLVSANSKKISHICVCVVKIDQMHLFSFRQHYPHRRACSPEHAVYPNVGRDPLSAPVICITGCGLIGDQSLHQHIFPSFVRHDFPVGRAPRAHRLFRL